MAIRGLCTKWQKNLAGKTNGTQTFPKRLSLGRSPCIDVSTMVSKTGFEPGSQKNGLNKWSHKFSQQNGFTKWSQQIVSTKGFKKRYQTMVSTKLSQTSVSKNRLNQWSNKRSQNRVSKNGLNQWSHKWSQPMVPNKWF